MKRANVSLAREEAGIALVTAARNVLEQFPLVAEPEAGASSSASDLQPVDPKEVAEMLVGLLPSPHSLLTDEFYRAPLFPVVLLKDVADLYSFYHIPDEPFELFTENPAVQQNPSALVHVWFANFSIATTTPSSLRWLVIGSRAVRRTPSHA